jgi:hypothetical protein
MKRIREYVGGVWRRPQPARRRHGERGAALAELAMVVPVMLILLLVVFDLGRGFHGYMSVTNGARHAARAAMQDRLSCTKADLQPYVVNGSSPYAVTFAAPVEAGGLCYVTVSYHYTPVLPFVTTAFELPGVGPVGPLWDGNMSETAVAKVDGKTGDGA